MCIRDSLSIPSFDDAEKVAQGTFDVVYDWYHYAIVELTEVQGFKPDDQWIAKRLRICPTLVGPAIRRLIRTGLLKRKGTSYCKGHYWYQALAPRKSTLLSHQKNVHRLAEQSLQSQPIADRHFSNVTFSANSEQIESAKEMIREFRTKLVNHLQSGRPDAVLQVSSSMFRLDSVQEVQPGEDH